MSEQLDALLDRDVHFYGVDNNTFKLGDTVFEAVGDPDDGYRSYMSSVVVKDPDGLVFFTSPLASVRLTQVNTPTFDGYELVDPTSGHVWLAFGTDVYDSYYPTFTFAYSPVEP